MTALRWLIHSARCWWLRVTARDALDNIVTAMDYERQERRRMERALAKEEELQRAWIEDRKASRAWAAYKRRVARGME